ncbi:hypothetical protein GCM10023340_42560 [Nocardioides marinquilinus]|uniref:DUF3072 domain-containing protein n=1 Tax=Nocardioides marinquilinus TaxID=1210400 RepID=A0ABP9Q9A4_9ACTN
MSESNTHSDPATHAAPVDAAAEAAAEAPPTASGDVLGAENDSSAEKDPEQWVTGDEPMTGAQRSYLDTLARQAGETISADLTKAEASEHIDRLQEVTGRGQGT